MSRENLKPDTTQLNALLAKLIDTAYTQNIVGDPKPSVLEKIEQYSEQIYQMGWLAGKSDGADQQEIIDDLEWNIKELNGQISELNQQIEVLEGELDEALLRGDEGY